MHFVDRRALAAIAGIGAAMTVTPAHPAENEARASTTPAPAIAVPAPSGSTVQSGGFQAVLQTAPSTSAPGQIHFVQNQLSQHAQEMKDKLADPQKRAALREEHRDAIVRSHPDLGRALSIDSTRESQLIELLTDQQLRRLDDMFASEAQSPTLGTRIQDRADAHTREMEELRALLGEEGLRQLEMYRDTAPERAQVAHFEKALAAEDELSEAARERMIDALREEREQHISRLQSSGSPFTGAMPLQLHDPSHMARLSALANHNSLRAMEEASARLRSALKPILTSSQLETFGNLETAKLSAQRQLVARMLADAGISEADLSANKAVSPAPRKPATGRLGFDLVVQINGIDLKFPNVLVDNGGVAEVEVAEGLSMEAMPTLFEDGWFDVRLRFFEGTGAARRALPGTSSSGRALRLPDGSTSDAAIASTVVQGGKGYAVTVQMTKVRINN